MISGESLRRLHTEDPGQETIVRSICSWSVEVISLTASPWVAPSSEMPFTDSTRSPLLQREEMFAQSRPLTTCQTVLEAGVFVGVTVLLDALDDDRHRTDRYFEPSGQGEPQTFGLLAFLPHDILRMVAKSGVNCID